MTRVLEHSYSKAFRGGRCIRHLRSLEVVATFTNAVLWAGTHNPQMTNFSRPCLISTCTQTTGRRLNSSIGAMFLDSMIAVGIICMYCLEVADHWLSDASCRESVMVRTARWFTGSPAYDTMGRREVIQMTYRVYGLLTPYSSENKCICSCHCFSFAG